MISWLVQSEVKKSLVYTRWDLISHQCNYSLLDIFTAHKRSLGQGNIFTPVCHSVHMGGGGSASVHAGIPSPDHASPPSAEHAGRYSARAGGTHPTGMQSCYNRVHTSCNFQVNGDVHWTNLKVCPFSSSCTTLYFGNTCLLDEGICMGLVEALTGRWLGVLLREVFLLEEDILKFIWQYALHDVWEIQPLRQWGIFLCKIKFNTYLR